MDGDSTCAGSGVLSTRDCGREDDAAEDERTGAADVECVLPGREVGVVCTGVIAMCDATCGASFRTTGRVIKGGSATLG